TESQLMLDPRTGASMIDPNTGRFLRDFFYRVSPGLGIAENGETIFVPTSTRIPVKSLPVYATIALLDEADRILDIGDRIEADRDTGDRIEVIKRTGLGRSLANRRVGRSLDQIIASSVDLPKVGILVLQPVTVEIVGELNPDDPCEED